MVGDQEYTFSNKQAQVIEALYQAWHNGIRQLHQIEIQGIAGTTQRVVQLFDGHPAYGSLIKGDNHAYYWLDL